LSSAPKPLPPVWLTAFAVAVKVTRKMRKLTQADAAQRSGIGRHRWSRLECAQEAPDAATIRTVAEALGVDFHDFASMVEYFADLGARLRERQTTADGEPS
jgi:transcriptional regulator with XRE-family HTH domain